MTDRPQATAVTEFKNAIEFQNVCFSYDGKTEVLKDISFTAEKGRVIALVGPSGGGEAEPAASVAMTHPFLPSFPNGYAAIIGDRGVMLSGGRRQRLAIARAILKNP